MIVVVDLVPAPTMTKPWRRLRENFALGQFSSCSLNAASSGYCRPTDRGVLLRCGAFERRSKRRVRSTVMLAWLLLRDGCKYPAVALLMQACVLARNGLVSAIDPVSIATGRTRDIVNSL